MKSHSGAATELRFFPDGRASGPANQRSIATSSILESLPGVGRLILATILTDASQPLANRNSSMLRGCMGIAPVTQRSGKGRPFVRMRRACNDRLRRAASHWGRVSIQVDVAGRTNYDHPAVVIATAVRCAGSSIAGCGFLWRCCVSERWTT